MKSADLVVDTNQESPWSLSPTFVICVHRLCCWLSPCIVMDWIPLEWHKRVCRGLVADFITTVLTCWSRWFLSMTFMISVGESCHIGTRALLVACLHCFRYAGWGGPPEWEGGKKANTSLTRRPGITAFARRHHATNLLCDRDLDFGIWILT